MSADTGELTTALRAKVCLSGTTASRTAGSRLVSLLPVGETPCPDLSTLVRDLANRVSNVGSKYR
jgi:hypothetical protein